MLLDILDCMTAPAGVVTPFAPTATGNNISTAAVIDRTIAMEDGMGTDIDFIGIVTTTVTSGGAATVQFQLLGNATDPTFGSNNVVLYQSIAIPFATLVAGYRLQVPKIPRAAFLEFINATAVAGGPVNRYYTVNVIIGTAVLTAGAFNFWLTSEFGVQDNVAYKSNYTV